MLDWRKGGFFRVAPAAPYETSRRYLPATNILETTFRTDGGTLVLTDCIPVNPRGEHDPVSHPYHQLARGLVCTEGSVEVSVEFVPRFDYGLTVPRVEVRDDHTALAYGGPDGLLLQTDLGLERLGLGECGASVAMHAGDEHTLLLTYALAHELRVVPFDPEEATRRFAQTERFWREWSGQMTYEGPYHALVERSALVLKALINAPTGAIVAAPTTSLPEHIGGERNWDYRYTWIRDAALDLFALFELGHTKEAHEFMRWVERTTAGRAKDLQVLYGVGGERLIPEIELAHLEGYRGSAPVRIGNHAAQQFQLDIYGELLDAAWQYHRHGGQIGDSQWELLSDVVSLVGERWQEPDRGIWEPRDRPRHHTSSKVLAWVAVDRGIKLARALGHEENIDEWKKLRTAIRTDVEAKGATGPGGAFTRAYDDEQPDASNLMIALTGFLPPNDPRVRETVEWIQRDLSKGPLVHRYPPGSDGLAGPEGAFVICGFWLISNLAIAGEVEEARALFEELTSYANDVGLLAEEIDRESGEMLGNFPQAFSHVGLIRAAITLRDAAEKGVSPGAPRGGPVR